MNLWEIDIYPAADQPDLLGRAVSADAAELVYRELWDKGVETLFDDREDQAAGVKFNDADLLGLPVRLVVSPRNLREGRVEIKGRKETEAYLVPMEDSVAHVRQFLSE